MRKNLSSNPSTVIQVGWFLPVILAFVKQRQEDQNFMVIFGYLRSLKPEWAT